MTSLYPEVYLKALRTMPTLHQIDKEGCFIHWDDACQQAFEKIKRYLTHPPVYTAPVSGKSFLIYVQSMDHSLGALLAQNNDQEHE